MPTFITKLLAPKTLSVISLGASASSVTLGLIDGEPMSTLSFVGLCTALTSAAVLGAVTLHDIQSRLAALDAKKEA